MAETVEITLAAFAVSHQLGTGVAFSASPVLTYNATAPSMAETINGSSAGPISKISAQLVTLTAGAATLDLQALPGVNGATLDMTGLKLQLLYIKPVTGAAVMTFGPGYANGYNIGNNSSFLITAFADCPILFRWRDNCPAVANADSEIDIAGTGTDQVYILMAFGTA